MRRKVVWVVACILTTIMSTGLAGGQVSSGGFLWWGVHEPIYIYGNDGFTVQNGVMSGSGSIDDPYIIEGWRIEAPRADYGIYIDHTTAYFVIRDCVIERGRTAGIYFNTVANGRVESCQVTLSETAIYLANSRDNGFFGNVIADCNVGLVAAINSRDNVIAGNGFFGNGLQGLDQQRFNRWYDGTSGNYWSDYRGADVNGDGIGDEPYYAVWDSYPLIDSPVEQTNVAMAGYTYAGNTVSPDGALVVTSRTPITLTSGDAGSGLLEVYYSIDGGSWLAYDGPIYLQGDDGPQTLAYYGVDKLGNIESTTSVRFILDNHTPVTQIVIGEPQYEDGRGIWITSSTPIELERVRQSTYGRARTYYQIDGGSWRQYSSPLRIQLPDGPHMIRFYSQNASGVAEEPQSVLLIVDDAPPATRGAQASSPADAGQDSTSVDNGGIELIVGPTQETQTSSQEPVSDAGTSAEVSGPEEEVPDSAEADDGTGVQPESEVVSEATTAPSLQTPSSTTMEEPDIQTASTVVTERESSTQSESETLHR